MEEQSHHCNTGDMRQKGTSRESKSCDGGIQSQSSQTAHSALHLSHGKGDESCDGGIGSRSSQTTIHSQTRFSTSSSSGARGDDNGGGRSGSRPSKATKCQ
eukprot:15345605-Ditylum_brightwellii.AAC.2